MVGRVSRQGADRCGTDGVWDAFAWGEVSGTLWECGALLAAGLWQRGKADGLMWGVAVSCCAPKTEPLLHASCLMGQGGRGGFGV